MNLFFRMLRVLLRCWWASRLEPLDESVVRFRVWPQDLDVNFHMNNGRYLTVMDLGRLDLTLRMGFLPLFWGRRWLPMVGAATIRFQRPLKAFQRYELHTRILGWGEKWFFMEQRFTQGGKLIARGLIKGLLRGPEGNVPPDEILEALGRSGFAAPDLPAEVRAWDEFLGEEMA
jgi:acyl-CoA thioesterase FadM